MSLVTCVLLFVLGLILLIWGSDLFVDDAVSLATLFHIPEVIIGATIVSIGTTLPEVLFSSTAAYQGMTDAAIGNALGSIICNTGLIAGISLIFQPLHPDRGAQRSIRSSFLWMIPPILLYLFCSLRMERIPRNAGFLLLAAFILYNLKTFAGKKRQVPTGAASMQENHLPVPVILIKLAAESCVLFIGAKILVTEGPILARAIHVPEMVISLTFVALGTSLPELMTAIASLRKKRVTLSIGNILGADFLNLTLVGGLSACIRPLDFPRNLLFLELPLVMLFLSLLCLPTLVRKQTYRMQGFLLVLSYGAYVAYQFLQ